MSQQSGSETFNILIEDLDFADQKNISKGKMLQNVLLKCQRKIVTIILIILVIAMVAIGKAPTQNYRNQFNISKSPLCSAYMHMAIKSSRNTHNYFFPRLQREEPNCGRFQQKSKLFEQPNRNGN